MYKVEKYLPRCLDSILSQTFVDWSAILVDDGSPDNSGKIAEKYAKRDKRFKVVHKENGGLSSARNAGMCVANGKYIMFLDSDDCIHPQTMEILYTIAERENVDIVSFDYNRALHNAPDAVNFPPDNSPEYFEQTKYDTENVKYRRFNHLICRATNRDYGINAWWVQTCMVTMRMYRADFILGLSFDETISVLEDTVFWSAVLMRNPSGVITRLPLYYYTVNPGSILHSNNGVRGLVDIIRGMGDVAMEYMRVAPRRVIRVWARAFLWDILSRVYRSGMRINIAADRKIVAQELKKLRKNGILDLIPDFHAWRYSRRLKRFISQNT